MRKFVGKYIAATLAILVFLSNAAFIHAAETNFWKERQAQTTLSNSSSNRELAQLPTPLSPLNRSLSPLSSPSSSVQRSLPLELEKKANSSDLEQLKLLFQTLGMDNGQIRTIGMPRGQIKSPFVLHIQDIHQNEEAQLNISRTIQKLADANLISHLLLEGESKPINIDSFRHYPHQDVVSDVADYLLKKNQISGSIHAALKSPKWNLPIIGIDDAFHYQANIKAYRNAQPHQAKMSAQVNQALQTINKSKIGKFPSSLSQLDQSVQDYLQNNVSLFDHFLKLSRLVGETPLTAQVFIEASKLEAKINFTDVENQRNMVIKKLVEGMSKDQLDELTQQSVAYRFGQISHTQFYSYIRKLCQDHYVTLKRYPAFDMYIQYLLLADSIEMNELMASLDDMEKSAVERLASSPEQKKLIAETKALLLAQKLTQFSLTPQEWSSYTSLRNHINPLQSSLKSFELFFEEAEIRDEKMSLAVKQSLSKKNSQKVVVLITGGFHAKGIENKLTQSGHAVLGFVPKITVVEKNGESHYLSVFAQEKTPLEKMFEGQVLFLPQPPSRGFLIGALISIGVSVQRYAVDAGGMLSTHFQNLSKILSVSVVKISNGIRIQISKIQSNSVPSIGAPLSADLDVAMTAQGQLVSVNQPVSKKWVATGIILLISGLYGISSPSQTLGIPAGQMGGSLVVGVGLLIALLSRSFGLAVAELQTLFQRFSQGVYSGLSRLVSVPFQVANVIQGSFNTLTVGLVRPFKASRPAAVSIPLDEANAPTLEAAKEEAVAQPVSTGKLVVRILLATAFYLLISQVSLPFYSDYFSSLIPAAGTGETLTFLQKLQASIFNVASYFFYFTGEKVTILIYTTFLFRLMLRIPYVNSWAKKVLGLDERVKSKKEEWGRLVYWTVHLPIAIVKLVYEFGFAKMVRLIQITENQVVENQGWLERQFARAPPLLQYILLPFVIGYVLILKRILLLSYSTLGQVMLMTPLTTYAKLATDSPDSSLHLLSELISINALDWILGPGTADLLAQHNHWAALAVNLFSLFNFVSIVLLAHIMSSVSRGVQARAIEKKSIFVSIKEGLRVFINPFAKVSLYGKDKQPQKGKDGKVLQVRQYRLLKAAVLGLLLVPLEVELATTASAAQPFDAANSVIQTVEVDVMGSGHQLVDRALNPFGVSTNDVPKVFGVDMTMSDLQQFHNLKPTEEEKEKNQSLIKSVNKIRADGNLNAAEAEVVWLPLLENEKQRLETENKQLSHLPNVTRDEKRLNEKRIEGNENSLKTINELVTKITDGQNQSTIKMDEKELAYLTETIYRMDLMLRTREMQYNEFVGNDPVKQLNPEIFKFLIDQNLNEAQIKYIAPQLAANPQLGEMILRTPRLLDPLRSMFAEQEADAPPDQRRPETNNGPQASNNQSVPDAENINSPIIDNSLFGPVNNPLALPINDPPVSEPMDIQVSPPLPPEGDGVEQEQDVIADPIIDNSLFGPQNNPNPLPPIPYALGQVETVAPPPPPPDENSGIKINLLPPSSVPVQLDLLLESQDQLQVREFDGIPYYLLDSSHPKYREWEAGQRELEVNEKLALPNAPLAYIVRMDEGNRWVTVGEVNSIEEIFAMDRAGEIAFYLEPEPGVKDPLGRGEKVDPRDLEKLSEEDKTFHLWKGDQRFAFGVKSAKVNESRTIAYDHSRSIENEYLDRLSDPAEMLLYDPKEKELAPYIPMGVMVAQDKNHKVGSKIVGYFHPGQVELRDPSEKEPLGHPTLAVPSLMRNGVGPDWGFYEYGKPGELIEFTGSRDNRDARKQADIIVLKHVANGKLLNENDDPDYHNVWAWDRLEFGGNAIRFRESENFVGWVNHQMDVHNAKKARHNLIVQGIVDLSAAGLHASGGSAAAYGLKVAFSSWVLAFNRGPDELTKNDFHEFVFNHLKEKNGVEPDKELMEQYITFIRQDPELKHIFNLTKAKKWSAFAMEWAHMTENAIRLANVLIGESDSKEKTVVVGRDGESVSTPVGDFTGGHEKTEYVPGKERGIPESHIISYDGFFKLFSAFGIELAGFEITANSWSILRKFSETRFAQWLTGNRIPYPASEVPLTARGLPNESVFELYDHGLQVDIVADYFTIQNYIDTENELAVRIKPPFPLAEFLGFLPTKYIPMTEKELDQANIRSVGSVLIYDKNKEESENENENVGGLSKVMSRLPLLYDEDTGDYIILRNAGFSLAGERIAEEHKRFLEYQKLKGQGGATRIPSFDSGGRYQADDSKTLGGPLTNNEITESILASRHPFTRLPQSHAYRAGEYAVNESAGYTYDISHLALLLSKSGYQKEAEEFLTYLYENKWAHADIKEKNWFHRLIAKVDSYKGVYNAVDVSSLKGTWSEKIAHAGPNAELLLALSHVALASDQEGWMEADEDQDRAPVFQLKSDGDYRDYIRGADKQRTAKINDPSEFKTIKIRARALDDLPEDLVDWADDLGTAWLHLMKKENGFRVMPHGPNDLDTVSTEENMRWFQAFMTIYQLTGDNKFASAAMDILGWLSTVYDKEKGYFYQGTYKGNANTAYVSDPQILAGLMIPNELLMYAKAKDGSPLFNGEETVSGLHDVVKQQSLVSVFIQVEGGKKISVSGLDSTNEEGRQSIPDRPKSIQFEWTADEVLSLQNYERFLTRFGGPEKPEDVKKEADFYLSEMKKATIHTKNGAALPISTHPVEKFAGDFKMPNALDSMATKRVGFALLNTQPYGFDTPTMDTINSLPKFGFPTDGMTEEEIEEYENSLLYAKHFVGQKEIENHKSLYTRLTADNAKIQEPNKTFLSKWDPAKSSFIYYDHEKDEEVEVTLVASPEMIKNDLTQATDDRVLAEAYLELLKSGGVIRLDSEGRFLGFVQGLDAAFDQLELVNKLNYVDRSFVKNDFWRFRVTLANGEEEIRIVKFPPGKMEPRSVINPVNLQEETRSYDNGLLKEVATDQVTAENKHNNYGLVTETIIRDTPSGKVLEIHKTMRVFYHEDPAKRIIEKRVFKLDGIQGSYETHYYSIYEQPIRIVSENRITDIVYDDVTGRELRGYVRDRETNAIIKTWTTAFDENTKQSKKTITTWADFENGEVLSEVLEVYQGRECVGKFAGEGNDQSRTDTIYKDGLQVGSKKFVQNPETGDLTQLVEETKVVDRDETWNGQSVIKEHVIEINPFTNTRSEYDRFVDSEGRVIGEIRGDWKINIDYKNGSEVRETVKWFYQNNKSPEVTINFDTPYHSEATTTWGDSWEDFYIKGDPYGRISHTINNVGIEKSRTDVTEWFPGTNRSRETTLTNIRTGEIEETSRVTGETEDGLVKIEVMSDDGSVKWSYVDPSDPLGRTRKEFRQNGSIETIYTYDKPSKVPNKVSTSYLNGDNRYEIETSELKENIHARLFLAYETLSEGMVDLLKNTSVRLRTEYGFKSGTDESYVKNGSGIYEFYKGDDLVAFIDIDQNQISFLRLDGSKQATPQRPEYDQKGWDTYDANFRSTTGERTYLVGKFREYSVKSKSEDVLGPLKSNLFISTIQNLYPHMVPDAHPVMLPVQIDNPLNEVKSAFKLYSIPEDQSQENNPEFEWSKTGLLDEMGNELGEIKPDSLFFDAAREQVISLKISSALSDRYLDREIGRVSYKFNPATKSFDYSSELVGESLRIHGWDGILNFEDNPWNWSLNPNPVREEIRDVLGGKDIKIFEIHDYRQESDLLMVFDGKHKQNPIAEIQIDRSVKLIKYKNDLKTFDEFKPDNNPKIDQLARERFNELAFNEVVRAITYDLNLGTVRDATYLSEVDLTTDMDKLRIRMEDLDPKFLQKMERAKIYKIHKLYPSSVVGNRIVPSDTVIEIYNKFQKIVKIDPVINRISLNYFDPQTPYAIRAGVDYQYKLDPGQETNKVLSIAVVFGFNDVNPLPGGLSFETFPVQFKNDIKNTRPVFVFDVGMNLPFIEYRSKLDGNQIFRVDGYYNDPARHEKADHLHPDSRARSIENRKINLIGFIENDNWLGASDAVQEGYTPYAYVKSEYGALKNLETSKIDFTESYLRSMSIPIQSKAYLVINRNEDRTPLVRTPETSLSEVFDISMKEGEGFRIKSLRHSQGGYLGKELVTDRIEVTNEKGRKIEVWFGHVDYDALNNSIQKDVITVKERKDHFQTELKFRMFLIDPDLALYGIGSKTISTLIVNGREYPFQLSNSTARDPKSGDVLYKTQRGFSYRYLDISSDEFAQYNAIEHKLTPLSPEERDEFSDSMDDLYSRRIILDFVAGTFMESKDNRGFLKLILDGFNEVETDIYSENYGFVADKAVPNWIHFLEISEGNVLLFHEGIPQQTQTYQYKQEYEIDFGPQIHPTFYDSPQDRIAGLRDLQIEKHNGRTILKFQDVQDRRYIKSLGGRAFLTDGRPFYDEYRPFPWEPDRIRLYYSDMSIPQYSVGVDGSGAFAQLRDAIIPFFKDPEVEIWRTFQHGFAIENGHRYLVIKEEDPLRFNAEQKIKGDPGWIVFKDGLFLAQNKEWEKMTEEYRGSMNFIDNFLNGAARMVAEAGAYTEAAAIVNKMVKKDDESEAGLMVKPYQLVENVPDQFKDPSITPRIVRWSWWHLSPVVFVVILIFSSIFIWWLMGNPFLRGWKRIFTPFIKSSWRTRINLNEAASVEDLKDVFSERDAAAILELKNEISYFQDLDQINSILQDTTLNQVRHKLRIELANPPGNGLTDIDINILRGANFAGIMNSPLVDRVRDQINSYLHHGLLTQDEVVQIFQHRLQNYSSRFATTTQFQELFLMSIIQRAYWDENYYPKERAREVLSIMMESYMERMGYDSRDFDNMDQINRAVTEILTVIPTQPVRLPVEPDENSNHVDGDHITFHGLGSPNTLFIVDNRVGWQAVPFEEYAMIRLLIPRAIPFFNTQTSALRYLAREVSTMIGGRDVQGNFNQQNIRNPRQIRQFLENHRDFWFVLLRDQFEKLESMRDPRILGTHYDNQGQRRWRFMMLFEDLNDFFRYMNNESDIYEDGHLPQRYQTQIVRDAQNRGRDLLNAIRSEGRSTPLNALNRNVRRIILEKRSWGNNVNNQFRNRNQEQIQDVVEGPIGELVSAVRWELGFRQRVGLDGYNFSDGVWSRNQQLPLLSWDFPNSRIYRNIQARHRNAVSGKERGEFGFWAYLIGFLLFDDDDRFETRSSQYRMSLKNRRAFLFWWTTFVGWLVSITFIGLFLFLYPMYESIPIPFETQNLILPQYSYYFILILSLSPLLDLLLLSYTAMVNLGKWIVRWDLSRKYDFAHAKTIPEAFDLIREVFYDEPANGTVQLRVDRVQDLREIIQYWYEDYWISGAERRYLTARLDNLLRFYPNTVPEPELHLLRSALNRLTVEDPKEYFKNWINKFYRKDLPPSPTNLSQLRSVSINVAGATESSYFFWNGVDDNGRDGIVTQNDNQQTQLVLLATAFPDEYRLLLDRLSSGNLITSDEHTDLLRALSEYNYNAQILTSNNNQAAIYRIEEWVNIKTNSGYANMRGAARARAVYRRQVDRIATRNNLNLTEEQREQFVNDHVQLVFNMQRFGTALQEFFRNQFQNNLSLNHNLDEIRNQYANYRGAGRDTRGWVDEVFTSRGIAVPNERAAVGGYIFGHARVFIDFLVKNKAEIVYGAHQRTGDVHPLPAKYMAWIGSFNNYRGEMFLALDWDQRNRPEEIMFLPNLAREFELDPLLGVGPYSQNIFTKSISRMGLATGVMEQGFVAGELPTKDEIGAVGAYGKFAARTTALRNYEGLPDEYVAEDIETALRLMTFGWRTRTFNYYIYDKGLSTQFGDSLKPFKKWAGDAPESLLGAVPQKFLWSPHVHWTKKVDTIMSFAFYLKKPSVERATIWVLVLFFYLNLNPWFGLPYMLLIGAILLSQSIGYGGLMVFYERYGWKGVAYYAYLMFLRIFPVATSMTPQYAEAVRLGFRGFTRFVLTGGKGGPLQRAPFNEIWIYSSVSISKGILLAFLIAASSWDPVKIFVWAPQIYTVIYGWWMGSLLVNPSLTKIHRVRKFLEIFFYAPLYAFLDLINQFLVVIFAMTPIPFIIRLFKPNFRFWSLSSLLQIDRRIYERGLEVMQRADRITHRRNSSLYYLSEEHTRAIGNMRTDVQNFNGNGALARSQGTPAAVQGIFNSLESTVAGPSLRRASVVLLWRVWRDTRRLNRYLDGIVLRRLLLQAPLPQITYAPAPASASPTATTPASSGTSPQGFQSALNSVRQYFNNPFMLYRVSIWIGMLFVGTLIFILVPSIALDSLTGKPFMAYLSDSQPVAMASMIFVSLLGLSLVKKKPEGENTATPISPSEIPSVGWTPYQKVVSAVSGRQLDLGLRNIHDRIDSSVNILPESNGSVAVDKTELNLWRSWVGLSILDGANVQSFNRMANDPRVMLKDGSLIVINNETNQEIENLVQANTRHFGHQPQLFITRTEEQRVFVSQLIAGQENAQVQLIPEGILDDMAETKSTTVSMSELDKWLKTLTWMGAVKSLRVISSKSVIMDPSDLSDDSILSRKRAIYILLSKTLDGLVMEFEDIGNIERITIALIQA